jgi:hypothetical protein
LTFCARGEPSGVAVWATKPRTGNKEMRASLRLVPSEFGRCIVYKRPVPLVRLAFLTSGSTAVAKKKSSTSQSAATTQQAPTVATLPRQVLSTVKLIQLFQQNRVPEALAAMRERRLLFKVSEFKAAIIDIRNPKQFQSYPTLFQHLIQFHLAGGIPLRCHSIAFESLLKIGDFTAAFEILKLLPHPTSNHHIFVLYKQLMEEVTQHIPANKIPDQLRDMANTWLQRIEKQLRAPNSTTIKSRIELVDLLLMEGHARLGQVDEVSIRREKLLASGTEDSIIIRNIGIRAELESGKEGSFERVMKELNLLRANAANLKKPKATKRSAVARQATQPLVKEAEGKNEEPKSPADLIVPNVVSKRHEMKINLNTML